jgi:hypothetical protein
MSLVGRYIAVGLFAAALAGTVQAQQATDRAERTAKAAIQTPAAHPSESVAVSVLDGRGLVWSGTLRIGGTYGSASFSQSKNEFADPCPGAAKGRITRA